MFYGRIWLVVKPSVGIPMFFVAIATTALIVHAAILFNTSWYPAYFNGGAKPKGVASSTVDPAQGAPQVAALATK
jgi:light-harvesting protein B-800-850 alpha chain